MKRDDFIKKGLLGAAFMANSGSISKLLANQNDELKELELIGFNHLPNKKSEIMANTIFSFISKRSANYFI